MTAEVSGSIDQGNLGVLGTHIDARIDRLFY